jgi:hypothetical protein
LLADDRFEGSGLFLAGAVVGKRQPYNGHKKAAAPGGATAVDFST